eukprot:TRINITY_DN13678_c0_g2_i1.p1 TRINITY_DN13678_c0_g2~~TRINITY_DN13678_c0_g2_i1.p1  ORF type:complete len:152 (-),score=38.23 TRINITY_DN13678_c0_g2_i1:118-573(-)
MKNKSITELPIADAGSRGTEIKKPPMHPKYSSKKALQKEYSRLANTRLRNLQHIFNNQLTSNLDDQQMARFIFAQRKAKRSSSLLDISNLVDLNEPRTLELTKDERTGAEDDIGSLRKLSMLNMGARYELLNANQMMVDLDLELVRVLVMG